MLLMLKSVLKQRVNIQFCILNESSATRNYPETGSRKLAARSLISLLMLLATGAIFSLCLDVGWVFCLGWVSGRPGEAPAYAGTDFIIARDGRIAAIYLFFLTDYPELSSAVVRPPDNERTSGPHIRGPYLASFGRCGCCQE